MAELDAFHSALLAVSSELLDNCQTILLNLGF